MSQRDNVLDVLKGIGMFLVVFAHTYMGALTGKIYLFHMPLFFIASGCMYAIGKGGLISGKVKSLMIPYFVFSFLSFAYWYLIESRFRPMPTLGVFGDNFNNFNFMGIAGQQFLNIFLAINGEKSFIYNVPLWFLPCLLVTHVLRNSLKCNTLIGGGLCVAIYYVIRSYGIKTLPFHADIALLMVMFMIIGEKTYHLLHEQVNSWRKILTLSFISLSVFAVLAFLSNASMDLNTGKVPKVWWLYTIPVFGYGMVYGLSWMVDKYGGYLNKPLLWLGRNSLLVMCLHEPIKRLVIKAFAVAMNSETDALRQSLPTSLIISIVVFLVCFPLTWVISNRMPWMIGKSLQK